MVKRLLVLFLALVASSAFAFDPYPDFTFAPASGGMGATVTRGSASGWASGTAGAEAGNLTRSFSRAVPFVPPTTGTFKFLFSPRNLARGMATGAAVAIPMFAGDAFSWLMGQACVRVAGGALQLAPGGQWEECKFANGIGYWIPGYPEADTLSPSYSTTCELHRTKHLAWISGGTSADIVVNNTHFCAIYMSNGQEYTRGGYNTDTMQVSNGWGPTTAQVAEDKLANAAAVDAASTNPADVTRLQQILDAEMAAGQPVEGSLAAPTLAPVTVPGKTTTTTDSTGKSITTQEQTRNDYSCTVIQNGQALSCTQTQTTTTTGTTVDPSTNTTTTATTTTTGTTDPSQETRVKIDETGMPTAPQLQLDEPSITQQHTTNKTAISGTADKNQFSGWTSLFVTPPVVACEPTSFQMQGGQSVSVDACGVVDGVRTIMAWLWALAGFWVCLGFIREAV
jgi:hypothetical protein